MSRLRSELSWIEISLMRDVGSGEGLEGLCHVTLETVFRQRIPSIRSASDKNGHSGG